MLQALAPFVLLSGPALLASLAVNYLGAARSRVPVAIAALGINAVWDVIFLSKMGIVAGAIGTDLAYAIWVPAHLLILRRLLGPAAAPDRPRLPPRGPRRRRRLPAAGRAWAPIQASPCWCSAARSPASCTRPFCGSRGRIGPADIGRMREIVGRRIAWVSPR